MGGQVDFVKEQLRKWRGIERILNEKDFHVFLKELDSDDKDHIQQLVLSGDYDKLKLWLIECKARTLEGMCITDIRKIASELGIQYYNLHNKNVLIYKIRKIRKQKNES